MSASAVWKESFRVRSYETDPTGRASIATICNYLQEAAGNHAFSLGVSVEHFHDRPHTWMLARLRVLIDRYPRWRDDVTIETWPCGVERLFAMRDYLILDGVGGPLGRATSAWMLIDLERRRPVRMPETVTSLELPDRRRALGSSAAALSEPTAETKSETVRVEYNDLDVNGHVNNVRYVEWALEAIPASHREASDLTDIEVHFRTEAVYGDAVMVHAGAVQADGYKNSRTEFAHIIVQNESGKELARLRTQWQSR